MTEQFPKMNGKPVFVDAATRLCEVIAEGLETSGLAVADVELFIPHPANLRIAKSFCQRIGDPLEKTDCSIASVGNLAAAPAPIAVDERVQAGRTEPGDTVLMATFAAGFTWRAAVLHW